MRATRTRLWAARVALVLASLGLVLALGEIAARLTWREPTIEKSMTPEDALALPVLKGLRDLYQANVLGQHRGVIYRTNAHAMRGPDVEVVVESGVRRIGMGGDSVTVGWGVDEDRAYPVVLSSRLANAVPGVRWQTFNLGMAGLAAPQIVRRIERLDKVFDFDLLVYGYTLNDIEGPEYEKRGVGPLQMQMADRARRAMNSDSYLLRLLWPRYLSVREAIAPTYGSAADELVHNYTQNPAAWAHVDSALAQLAELSRRRNRCGVVLIHPKLTDLGVLHPYEPIYEQVGIAARSHGLFVVESLESFRGSYEPALWVAPRDPHPNADAHAVLATRLSEAIEALPSRCWGEGG